MNILGREVKFSIKKNRGSEEELVVEDVGLKGKPGPTPPPLPDIHGILSPGRVSVPNDVTNIIQAISGQTALITPSFRIELIPLIRNLYKVNADMSITVQDTFKLANTGHSYTFPYNSEEESNAMEMHLGIATKRWSNYTAGINGLVNKFIVQCLIGGAISIEAVPDSKLQGIATILLINPEDIIFKRLNNGVYHPYQINKNINNSLKKGQYIKLNTESYKYVGMFNDTDEPYGIPPYLAVLEALVTQKNMKVNFEQAMDLLGMIGFMEVKTEKPTKNPNESVPSYERRLTNHLKQLKANIYDGMKDGLVVGYLDDHEFNMNSTSNDLSNVDALWNMNQQTVANGLGSSGTLIGVNTSTTEGGAGILLSKMISQLKNIQELVTSVLEFIYTLELRLAGFPCKGIKVRFNTSTVSDEVKLQQAIEYKIRNLRALYAQGIISQGDIASEMGYIKPDQEEPREAFNPDTGSSGSGTDDPEAKKKREADKDKSDRKGRDKAKVIPKRQDQKTKPR